MRITVWNDYICPWAYLGRHRTRLLVETGHSVERMPYELHPELTEPTRIRPDGRLHALFDHIAAECDAVGVEFRAPSRVLNSRRALEMGELVRRGHPDSFESFDNAVARSYFVEDLDISDVEVIERILDGLHLDVDALTGALSDGDGVLAVVDSMRRARAAGITATPAWLFPNGFVIPGVQPVAHMTRWVERMASREDSEGADDRPSGGI